MSEKEKVEGYVEHIISVSYTHLDVYKRQTQGISTAEFEEKFGKEIHAVYGGVLKKYEAMHLLQEHSGRLALTRDGISVSNVILADFLL